MASGLRSTFTTDKMPSITVQQQKSAINCLPLLLCFENNDSLLRICMHCLQIALRANMSAFRVFCKVGAIKANELLPANLGCFGRELCQGAKAMRDAMPP